MSLSPRPLPEVPPRLQLALQGGGARICALLAAMEAVQSLESRHLLKVTRIAGTSAGSVVACLYAAGLSLSSIRAVLRSQPRERILSLFPRTSKFVMAWRVLRGQPFWPEHRLRRLLEQVFREARVRTLGDLEDKTGVKVMIVASDLVGGRSVLYKDPSDPIVSCLLDSCALPFFLRNASRGGAHTIVDGGLCENLPVEQLRREEAAYGPVVGVSFREWEAGTPPRSFLDFSKALLDTSMNAAVSRAKASLGADRLHSIGTPLRTFDFEKALDVGLAEAYDLARTEAEAWFAGLASSLRTRGPQHSLSGDPWATGDPKLLSRIWAVYRAQHEVVKYRYVRCSLVIQLNGLLEKGEPSHGFPDLVRYTIAFRPLDQPLTCISLAVSPLSGLSAASPTTFFGKTRWSVSDARNRELKTVGLPALNPAEPQNRELLIFFAGALRPAAGPAERSAEPYTLRFEDLVGQALPKLIRGRVDEMGLAFRRAAGPIGRADLVLQVPDRLRGARMVAKRGGTPGRDMTDEQLREPEFRAPLGFRALGWTASGLDPRVPFCVDVLP